MVTDLNGAPVAGATVHFLVTDGGGTVTPLQVTSDVTGRAQVTSWTLGQAGANQVTASGLGIAGPEDGGPFMPPMQLPPEEATPVTVGTGEVLFNATAVAPDLTPQLAFQSVEVREDGATIYNFDVLNYSVYPAAFFDPAPDLPPCGLNTTSSRTWVDIYNQDGVRIYGFCALGSPADLNGIWFGVAAGDTPPTAVYIVLTDRRAGVSYTSNRVNLTPEITLENVVPNTDGYTYYNLDVPNNSVIPNAIFAPAPDLPPCGDNTSSSRTWVDIYNQDNVRLYGFCALGSAAELNNVWFAVPTTGPQPTAVYIVLTDRQTEITYTSNRLSLSP